MLGTANKLKTVRQIALTGAVSGSTNFDGSMNVNINTSLQSQQLRNQDLNDYKTEGFYYAAGGNTCLNKPSGVNNFGLIIKRTAEGNYEQIMDINDVRYTRFWNGKSWSSWVKTITNGDFAVLKGTIVTTSGGTIDSTKFTTINLDFPSGFNANNCVVISWGLYQGSGSKYAFGHTNQFDSRTWLRNGVASMITFDYSGNGKMTLSIETPFSDSYTYNYEIVLMKITNPQVTLLGDANCDGVVNSADATLIQNYIQGKSALTLQGFVNADVTKDGDVKASDYAKLQDYLDGDISSLE